MKEHEILFFSHFFMSNFFLHFSFLSSFAAFSFPVSVLGKAVLEAHPLIEVKPITPPSFSPLIPVIVNDNLLYCVGAVSFAVDSNTCVVIK